MRLSFPNHEHADVPIERGEIISLGSASENTVMLTIDGIAAKHVRIINDQRGVILEVLDSVGHTHVNARRVREKAILRYGDTINLNTVGIILKAESAENKPSITTDTMQQARKPSAVSRIVLRGMSGSHFGKSIPINPRLLVGRSAECDLVLDSKAIERHHALVEYTATQLLLRSLESAEGALVNGILMKNGALHSGDQIVFDQHRFIVEAPGLAQGAIDEFSEPLIGLNGQSVVQGADNLMSRSSIWWLIGAAAMIGLGLAALLLST